MDAAPAAMMKPEADALPVVLELLNRPELKSRQVAVTALGILARNQEPAARAALQATADDPDPVIRTHVRELLRRLRRGEPVSGPSP
jgi:hypothetical protein